MGPAGAMPELPDLEMALVPASHRYVSKKWQDCNWVQALEGSIDNRAFHLRAFELRQGRGRSARYQEALRQSDRAHERRSDALDRRGPASRHQGQSHDAGLTIAGGRLTDSENIYWRIAQFMMPVHAYAPSAMPGENIFGQSFYPGDRHQLLDLHLCLDPERPPDAGRGEAYDRGNGGDPRGRRELRAAAQQGQTTI